MYREFPNIVSYLKKNGYRTGLLGKLHVEPQKAFPFDYKMGGFDYESPGLKEYGKPYEDVEVLTTAQNTDVKNVTFSQRVELMADSAEAFFKSAGSKPFFLMANFLDPHTPWYHQVRGYPDDPIDSTEVAQLPYFGQKVNTTSLAGYYNGCSRMDVGFDMIINKLKKAGMYKNTLIIFIGDHGAPLPRAKTYIYEAGLRIPFMMRFPDKDRRLEEKRFVSTIDILPTVLRAVGDSIPADLPGRPLQDLVHGDASGWRTQIEAEFNQHAPQYFFPQRSVTTSKYKLIISPFARVYQEHLPEGFNGDYEYMEGNDKKNAQRRYWQYSQVKEVEFYDLSKDPHEFHNLADAPEYSRPRDKLMAGLVQWQKRTNDPLLKEGTYKAYSGKIKHLINEYFQK